MATTPKVLGQADPLAATDTDLYTVPASTNVVGSTLTVCNRSGTATSFRIAIRPAGATIANQHYINYDTPIGANDSYMVTIGFTLEATDVITVHATAATLSFGAFGQEIS